VWDLVVRRAGLSLADALSDGAAPDDAPAYASGIPCHRGAEAVSAGTPHRAFKVKVGYDDARDLVHLAETAAALPTGAHLMTDANQAWDAAAAARFLDAAAHLGPALDGGADPRRRSGA
jgi:L-alanine-DL-glutamate epimerase-like enolase superfamily enzyme